MANRISAPTKVKGAGNMTTSPLHSSPPVGSRSSLRRSSCSLRPGRRFTPPSARRRESESRSSRKFRPASPAIAAVPDHPGKAPARDCHRPSPDTPRPHTGCESAWPWSGQTTAPQPRRSSPMCHFSRTDPFVIAYEHLLWKHFDANAPEGRFQGAAGVDL